MSSSRPSRNPAESNHNDIESFPTYPSSSAAGPSYYPGNTNSTTTTTTTTTAIDGRGVPTTTTTTAQPHQIGTVPVTVTSNDPDVVPYTRTTVTVPSQVRRRPIGIRRLPSASTVRQPGGDVQDTSSGRRRSNSAPQAPGTAQLSRQNTNAAQPTLPTLPEESGQRLQVPGAEPPPEVTAATATGVGRRRSVSNAARSIISNISRHSNEGDYSTPAPDYDDNVVDFLDVVDPEVSTLTTLTNVQNSLFVPDLGKWINRRPTYQLSRPVTARPSALQPAPPPTVSVTEPQEGELETVQESPSRTPNLQRTWSWQRQPPVHRSHSITSTMTDSHYAVLPPGVRLDDWSEEDMEALDDHVRHMLHSKKSKFNQKMKAFGQYVRRPLGFFVTLYATLITLFGLAWVLFLIGWIYVGDKQGYVVNVVDNVLVALFALVGDGMAPFRIVDTYHMIYIAHYHHLTWRLRKEKALPKLQDPNDLPEQREKEADPEAANPEDSEFSVLSQSQQKKLIHHQQKFSKSHSFYKPHETSTHHAFPLRLLVAVVVLLDCHSLFQIALGTCTWSIPYQTRPQALTATILSCSITVNITAGILISIGDRRTRKKEVVMRMARQELTQEAIKKVEKHKADREANVDRAAKAEGFDVSKEKSPQR